jgi:hypothetical protein
VKSLPRADFLDTGQERDGIAVDSRAPERSCDRGVLVRGTLVRIQARLCEKTWQKRRAGGKVGLRMRKHLSVLALPISHAEAVRHFVIIHVKVTTEHQVETVDAGRKVRSRGRLFKRTAEM